MPGFWGHGEKNHCPVLDRTSYWQREMDQLDRNHCKWETEKQGYPGSHAEKAFTCQGKNHKNRKGPGPSLSNSSVPGIHIVGKNGFGSTYTCMSTRVSQVTTTGNLSTSTCVDTSVRTHVYLHIWSCTCAPPHLCEHTSVCTHVYLHICVLTFAPPHLYTHVSPHLCICTYLTWVCVHTLMHHICVHVHLHLCICVQHMRTSTSVCSHIRISTSVYSHR